jgi:hypothetical protein
MIDANVFNFEAMKEAVGADPFADKGTKYKNDERFYTLAKDKDGNGAALIRFLPDNDRAMIQKLFKINTTIIKNGKKRFVNVFSPTNIGLGCPFQEKWQALWNDGKKDDAKVFSRGVRYITNIKVLKDPANPENEGKIFFYEMSGAMKEKIQNAVDPSEQDRSLGALPKEMFNPLNGNSFRLVAKKGSNGQINYDNSEVITEVNSIYADVQTALDDIRTNGLLLADLLAPTEFLSYEELTAKLDWVTFSDQDNGQGLTAEVAQVAPVQSEVQPSAQVQPSASVQAQVQPSAQAVPAQTTEQATSVAPAASSSGSLDSLLAGLI